MAPDRAGCVCRRGEEIMADGPRCQRRKQTKPRRNNGEWRM